MLAELQVLFYGSVEVIACKVPCEHEEFDDKFFGEPETQLLRVSLRDFVTRELVSNPRYRFELSSNSLSGAVTR